MNRIALRLSLALAAVLAAGAARAGTVDATFEVSANVKKTCTITAANIAVGDYDPIVTNATPAAAATGQGDIVVACTNKLGYSITLDGGTSTNRTMTNGTDTLSYELYRDSARTTVWDAASVVNGVGQGKTANTHTVFMSVPGGQEAATEGLYTDRVLATVNF
jgi:spore coat protein U domain-containing protein, fimbrial subunit CupE1/2/3/6